MDGTTLFFNQNYARVKQTSRGTDINTQSDLLCKKSIMSVFVTRQHALIFPPA